MKYLEVKSPGEIDQGAFTLLGASTKRDDSSKIGLYGSGNKYAIASMLRNDIAFKVFSGGEEIKFSTKPTRFRDKNFDVICVNGTETSLTADMGGSDWDSAFAPLREIYSNALDECEDSSLKRVTEVVPEEGFTKFYIEMNPEIEHFYNNVDQYFCFKNSAVLSKCRSGAIYESKNKKESRVFRKGILAWKDENLPAIFNYNLYDVTINESRVINSVYSMHSNIAYVLKETTNKTVINTLINGLAGGNAGTLEHKADWENWKSFSEEWGEVCKTKKFYPVEMATMLDEVDTKDSLGLPLRLLKKLKIQFPEIYVEGFAAKGDDEIFVESKPSLLLVDKVLDSISELRDTRYKHRLTDIDIKYVKFFNEHVMGYASGGTIYLSVNLDNLSIPEISKIIIEENEHNRSNFGDRTRQFQDHLFSLYYDELTSKKEHE